MEPAQCRRLLLLLHLDIRCNYLQRVISIHEMHPQCTLSILQFLGVLPNIFNKRNIFYRTVCAYHCYIQVILSNLPHLCKYKEGRIQCAFMHIQGRLQTIHATSIDPIHTINNSSLYQVCVNVCNVILRISHTHVVCTQLDKCIYSLVQNRSKARENILGSGQKSMWQKK